MDLQQQALNARKATYDINPLILGRWSPRAMSGEPLSDEEFLPLFEAARWAPSSFNNQPWRFIIAKRDTSQWEKLFSLLNEKNQAWVKNAAVIGVIISHTVFEYNGKPSYTHSHDTGAASENLAIEGIARNLVVHQMAGFDHERAAKELAIPPEYRVEAMVAIGKPAKAEVLPEEMRREPNDRKPLNELIFEGEFGKSYLK